MWWFLANRLPMIERITTPNNEMTVLCLMSACLTPPDSYRETADHVQALNADTTGFILSPSKDPR